MAGYLGLRDFVDNLPEFDQAYGVVSEFYQSLPWHRIGVDIILPDPDIANA